MSVDAVRTFVTRFVRDAEFRVQALQDFDTSVMGMDADERASAKRLRDAYVTGGPSGVMALTQEAKPGTASWWF